MLKDTSLVAVIGYEELFRRGQLIVAQNYRALPIVPLPGKVSAQTGGNGDTD